MWLEAEKMRENENPCETLKCLRAGFLFIYLFKIFNFIYGKGWVEFGYIFFGLNELLMSF